MALLPQFEMHDLRQLQRLMEVYHRPDLSPRDAMTLATQLAGHGYAEAGAVISALRATMRNEAAQAYLARLALRPGFGRRQLARMRFFPEFLQRDLYVVHVLEAAGGIFAQTAGDDFFQVTRHVFGDRADR